MPSGVRGGRWLPQHEMVVLELPPPEEVPETFELVPEAAAQLLSQLVEAAPRVARDVLMNVDDESGGLELLPQPRFARFAVRRLAQIRETEHSVRRQYAVHLADELLKDRIRVRAFHVDRHVERIARQRQLLRIAALEHQHRRELPEIGLAQRDLRRMQIDADVFCRLHQLRQERGAVTLAAAD